jgi:type IV pilus assembly protein PilV
MITHDNRTGGFSGRSRGFTLLEVMVSLIIISIGLLGIAKIHALAYSSTATAGTRSLVALQAAGLASSMHANRGYWANGLAPPVVTITNAAISDVNLAAVSNCASATGPACTAATMAAYDLQTYAAQLSQSLPGSNPTTVINCPVLIPVNCTIQVSWNEKAVSINKQGLQSTTGTTFTPTYLLYVEP